MRFNIGDIVTTSCKDNRWNEGCVILIVTIDSDLDWIEENIKRVPDDIRTILMNLQSYPRCVRIIDGVFCGIGNLRFYKALGSAAFGGYKFMTIDSEPDGYGLDINTDNLEVESLL